MESLLIILPLLVSLVFFWVNYQLINIIVTVLKVRKPEKLKICLTKPGRAFYLIITGIYLVVIGGSIYFMTEGLIINPKHSQTAYTALNVATICALVYHYFLARLIFLGHKQMMVGRILLDYRKIKRVSFPRVTKFKFTYGQKDYLTPLIFTDTTELKKAVIRK